MEYKINRRVAKKLYEEFNKTQVEIAEIYNTTRAGVSRLFTEAYSEVKYIPEIDKATAEEIKLISIMVEKRLYNYSVKNIKIKLFNNLNGKYGFIIISKEKNKVIFNEDFETQKEWKDIIKMIKENRLNELSEEELELIEKSEEVLIMKKRCFRPNNYVQFHKLKKMREMNEEEYAKFLGYENLATKNIENTDDKIIRFFEENIIDGKVYISSEEKWIRRYLSRQKMSVEEFINFFGYEQRINRDKKIKKGEKVTRSLKYIDVLLQKLQLDQKGKDKIRNIEKNQKLIVERSKDIIKTLKELYGGKCQICQNKILPPIIQKDNKIYCEAHHIKQLANAKLMIEEENEILDHYQNIVILCPHHHRYLHYNKGGNYKLKKESGELYFENDYDKVKVELNYHLK